MIAVFIVDDSETARRALRMALEKSPQLTVVGEAATADAAMRLIPRLNPHIVTMDVHLGRSDGVRLTEWIMTASPRPVIIVTGVNPTDPRLVYRALKAGALDVVGKLPAPNRPEYPALRGRLIRLVASMAAVPVVTRNRGRVKQPRHPRVSAGSGAENLDTGPRQVAERAHVVNSNSVAVLIGASTGGPPAVAELLGSLPAPLPWPIVVVQHIGHGFGRAFAEWLADVTPHEVVLVDTPRELAPGRVYVADGNRHAKLTNAKRIEPDDGPPDAIRPSADVLFRGAATYLGRATIGVLLTGMGSDGAAGLAALKEAGATTIVQSPETCVVAGMPQAAITAGVVDRIGSIPEIGEWLRTAIRAGRERARR